MRLTLWHARLLVLVVLLLACAADTPRGSWRPSLSPAWTASLKIVSGPRMAGGGWIGDPVVVYATQGDDLYLVAVDSRTGEEMWRKAAVPGAAPRGLSLTPQVFGGFPVYLRQGDKGALSARLVIADPTTGEDVIVTENALFASLPESCENAARAICIMAVTDTKETVATWRKLTIDSVDPALEAYPAVSPMPHGRPLGPRNMLLSTDKKGQEYIGVYGDDRERLWEGRELWRVPVVDVFGEEYSGGWWEWSYYPKRDMYVGSLKQVARRQVKSTRVIDLARDTKMAAIRRSSGKILWKEGGVDNLCSRRLWAPTSKSIDDYRRSSPIPVRCRVQGTVTNDFFEDAEYRSRVERVDIALEGYDLETGRARWSVPLGNSADALTWVAAEGPSPTPLIHSGATSIVVKVDRDSKMVDLTTGKVRPIGEQEALWCSSYSRATFEFGRRLKAPQTYWYGRRQFGYMRHGERLHYWCDINGKPVGHDQVGPVFVPNGISVQAGEFSLVATPKGLVAYQFEE